MAIIPLSTSADVRGAERLNKELAKTDKELEEITKRAKGAAGAAERLAKQADPQKRYNDQMAKLAVAVKKGGLELDHARTLAAKYQRQLDSAGSSGFNAFGPRMLTSVMSLVGGYVTLQGAVSTITRLLRDQEEQAQKAADATFAGLGSIGELQQVSPTGEAFKKNLGFARSLVSRGVVGDIGQASDITFALTSAGFSDEEKELLAAIGARKQVKGEGLVGFGGALRKSQALFGGPDGVSLADMADKIAATSAATQANATSTALAATQFSAASSTLGYSGDSSLAALALVEQKAKNIDEAATQVANLFDAIDKGGLNKGTLGGTLDAIQARIDAGEGAFDILGNKRAVKGFRALASQRGQLDAETARIAGSGGTFAQQQFLGVDPIVSTAAMREEAEGMERAAQDAATTERENIVDAIQARRRADRLNRGQDFRASVFGFIENTWDVLQADRGIIADATNEERLPPELRAASARWLLENVPAYQRLSVGITEDYLRRIAEAVEQKPARQE